LPTIPTTLTDKDGRFVIPDLDAGPYRLSFVAPAYVKQQYGQRTFPGQGSVLTLTAGQVLKDVVMDLTLAGNVSGRLRDSSGQPAAGVPVQLLKPAYNASGQKTFNSAGQTRTNDRGEYRIYWVTPGRYYLLAGSPPGPATGGIGGAGQPATPNDPGDSYLFSFFPGVTDIAIASSLEVTTGNEVTGDFFLPKQQVYSVRGRAIDATTNQPPPSLRVSLSFSMITGGGASWSLSAPYNASTGVFEIHDVVPGSYTLQVSSENSVGRMPLDVTANMPEFPVLLGTNVTLPGRLVVEGLDQSGVERIRVELRTASGVGSLVGTTNKDGTFRVDNIVPGEYRIGITGSADYFIKEARFDRTDVLNQPLKVVGTVPSGVGLEIVISPTVGQVSGVVTDGRLQPVAGVQAVLVPDKNRDRAELFKSGTTDQSGRFLITGIVPGDYTLFSWESLESYGYFDPEVLKQAEPSGKLIHVAGSSKQEVDVRIIPASK
jgi:5-hydroxyisourate hydrolase-like protein (transthyretin family)